MKWVIVDKPVDSGDKWRKLIVLLLAGRQVEIYILNLTEPALAGEGIC